MPLPKFSSRAFLAPMAGVSDPALRLLCKNHGAGLVVTEFTNIHKIVSLMKKEPHQILEYSEQERPLSIQVFGSDIKILEKAAKLVEPYFDIIDYNMGCPAPHITQQMAGGALLQESNLTRKIFQTLTSAVKKPITLKIRCGVSSASQHLFEDIAAIAEDEGIKMITLHPRTVKQGYSGKSDWSLIKRLKEITKIPIVGNGDIRRPEDARQMIDQTGCDYVMVGRGAMGNPFLFEQINEYLVKGTYKKFSLKDRLDLFFEYMVHALKYEIKFSRIKAQAIRFTKGSVAAGKLRLAITRSQNMSELRQTLNIAYVRNS